MKKYLTMSAMAVLLWQPTMNADGLDKETALPKALQNNPTYMAALANIDAADGSRLQASLRPIPMPFLKSKTSPERMKTKVLTALNSHLALSKLLRWAA